jgi:hypothetical protein
LADLRRRGDEDLHVRRRRPDACRVPFAHTVRSPSANKDGQPAPAKGADGLLRKTVIVAWGTRQGSQKARRRASRSLSV